MAARATRSSIAHLLHEVLKDLKLAASRNDVMYSLAKVSRSGALAWQQEGSQSSAMAPDSEALTLEATFILSFLRRKRIEVLRFRK